jgi:hypothetical protein
MCWIIVPFSMCPHIEQNILMLSAAKAIGGRQAFAVLPAQYRTPSGSGDELGFKIYVAAANTQTDADDALPQ